MRFFIFLFFLVSWQLSFSQKDSLDYDCYKNRPKLTWNDFLVRPVSEQDSKFAASVSTGLDFNWDYNIDNAQQNFSYDICARIYPGSSWVNENKRDSVLLAHEQLHYDITELHARKLKTMVSGYKLGRNIRKDLKVIYSNIETARNKMQSDYDKETGHSKNVKIQHLWDKKIDSLLVVYKMYQ